MAVYLRILSGVGQGQVLPVANEQPITIGRSSQATFAFDDALLSRKHCQIECRGALCRVMDLQSRNGTFVNGERITAQLIKPGDRIKVGSLLLEVSPASAHAQTEAKSPAYVGNPASSRGGSAVGTAAGTTSGGVPIPTGVGTSGTVAMPLPAAPPPLAALCQLCQRPITPQQARPLKGKIVCPVCLDRFDVDEDMIEGFKILERLQTTGIGTVYKAKQLLMERLVVVKTILTGGGSDEKAMRRFLREAKAGGKLSHPSIVELYDVNEQGDLMYLVLEFVDGETLDQLLKAARGPLPVADVVRYMTQIADALRYAHEQSIIHRDVKPGTIVVRREDRRAKLTDFTLAKNLERAGVSVITADGEAVGTPYYLSPEQVKSAKIADARSDIYAFGATFYHCLTGQLPIQARSYGEFIARVFTAQPVPVLQLVPQAPPGVAAVLERCLQKDPARRFGSMEEVVAHLAPPTGSSDG